MIRRACTRCGALTDQARCAKHRDMRPSSRDRGYDREWARTRRAYLDAHPLCEDGAGCLSPATDVDHIDGSGPTGNNDWANLQALCHGCHSRKTVALDGGFGR